MKFKFFAIFIFLLVQFNMHSQTDTTSVPYMNVDIPDVPKSILPNDSLAKKERVFDVVDEAPEFPGGMQVLYDFLGQNVQYPEIALEKNLQGKVYVEFIINEDGSLSNFEIVKGTYPTLNEEALRLTKIMPNWIPGKFKGEVVKVRYCIPINFTIFEDNSKKKKRKKK